MRFQHWLVVVAIGMAAGLLGVDGKLPATFAQESSAARPADAGRSPAGRSRAGLLALYDFQSADGPIVKDRAGVGTPIDLRIAEPKAIRRSDGALEVRGKTIIRSEQPAARLSEAIRRSGEITIEAWVTPAKTDQSGPARIVTLSRDPNQRNFTLGQEGDLFDVRFRTTKTSTNGIPSLLTSQGSLAARLTHVVYTRSKSGQTRIYLNGKQVAEQKIDGDLSNWAGDFHLALANEQSGDRPWLGTFHLVALYSRDLSPGEVAGHFHAGPGAATNPEIAHAQVFETKIAPLIANHCLECHDSATRKGGLDLSRKAAAMAGGESGKAIVPGKSAEGLLWEYVASDKMPKDRPALSAAEKKLLKRWIDDGAVWSLDVVDPAVYAHEGRGGGVWVRRLTVPEYIETVRSAVGVDIANEAREILPPDLRADGFSNTAYNLTVDLKHVEAYSRLAEMIVERMDIPAFAKRFSKNRKLSTDDTMREDVAAIGKWLFRGPLDQREEVTYSGIATTVASAGGDFDEAVRCIVEAMLQSPRFIYRIEQQQGDGTRWPAGKYEIASRLSYIVWGGPPDAELMRAADAGELDRSGVEKQARRMLDDPRAVERSVQFISEWLNLSRLENLRPDPGRFPNWDPALAADMRDETIAFFKGIVWKQQRPMADLFNAPVTFATPRLAAHYGLKPAGDGLARYDLSKTDGRGGLLTHGSVLTIGGDDASMVTRGLFVLRDLLRGVVKDPPPCVDTTPVPTKPGLTHRAVAEARIANQSCGGCHGKFEPLAFSLEKFDGLGAYRDKDQHENPLREDGTVLIPGAAEAVPYKSVAEFMNLLAESERVRETMTWKLTQFAVGRPLAAEDARIVQQIHASAQEGGGTYKSLIVAIVTSDLVMTTRTESPQSETNR